MRTIVIVAVSHTPVMLATALWSQSGATAGPVILSALLSPAFRQVAPHVRVPDPAPFRHHRAPAWPWPPDRGEHPRGDP
ncbi:hypothetical protein SMG44B_30611 [Stenotrophomonas maltophilia]